MGFEMVGNDERESALHGQSWVTRGGRGAQWMERLSLDAVMVAVVWGYALAGLVGLQMDLATLGILALSTWLTYVADRLRDTAPDKKIPLTERHLYYRDNYKLFRLAWLILFPFTVLLAVIFLPLWKVLWGCVLVMGIILYLYMLGKDIESSRRLLLKRLLVPLIFVVGVGWMAESWRSMEGGAASLVLFMAALTNVLLISYWENPRADQPGWLARFLPVALIGLFVVSQASLVLSVPVGLAGLVCSMAYFLIYFQLRSGKGAHIRAWVDVGLFLAALPILIF